MRSLHEDDLYALKQINDPQISPDGRVVLFSQQRVERKREKKFSNLWIVPTAGGEPRQFTFGDWRDSVPRWSPDGSQIAFLSTRGDEKQAQIYLIPVNGGEARRLTDLHGTISSMEWSPDGRLILVEFSRKDADAIEREQDEDKKNLGVVARHITRLRYKSDGIGFLPQDRTHLWLIDVVSGAATQLTFGEEHEQTAPAWSPDGTQIVYVANSSDDPDRNPQADDLYVIPAAGGEPRRLETFAGAKSAPSFSADGRWLAFTGSEGLDNFWRGRDLWIVPIDGSQPAQNLTRRYDLAMGDVTLSDVAGYKLTHDRSGRPIAGESSFRSRITAAQPCKWSMWKVANSRGCWMALAPWVTLPLMQSAAGLPICTQHHRTRRYLVQFPCR